MKKIGEKEDFQNSKYYKKLDYDDYPDFFPPRRHISESIIIKMDHLVQREKIISLNHH
jgi:hypothetical protein